MYHPYRAGYSVLPGLVPLGGEPVFQVDEHLEEYLAAKRGIAHQPYHEHQLDRRAMAVICRYMRQRLEREHPRFRPTEDFTQMALQVQEDLVIHQFAEDRDWMAACHVSLPSHWRPEEKIGRSFREIHAPVPGMKASDQLARSMLKGSFYRFVWGVEFQRRLNCHSDQPRADFNGQVWVKVERQVIVGFSDVSAALFVIRPYLVEPDLEALKHAVLGMTAEQRRYKQLPENFVQWLAGEAM